MGKNRKNETCFPCHLWEMEDANAARKGFRGTLVREYGEETTLEDGTVLHDNYVWDEGDRYLVRCKECGGLVMAQKSEFHSFSDDDDYYSDYIPIASVEEADLLNLLWYALDLEGYPYRGLRGNNFQYFWKAGEEPRPYDTEKLKAEIRKKYAKLPPAQKEMLEKMMADAGKEEKNNREGG